MRMLSFAAKEDMLLIESGGSKVVWKVKVVLRITIGRRGLD